MFVRTIALGVAIMWLWGRLCLQHQHSELTILQSTSILRNAKSSICDRFWIARGLALLQKTTV